MYASLYDRYKNIKKTTMDFVLNERKERSKVVSDNKKAMTEYSDRLKLLDLIIYKKPIKKRKRRKKRKKRKRKRRTEKVKLLKNYNEEKSIISYNKKRFILYNFINDHVIWSLIQSFNQKKLDVDIQNKDIGLINEKLLNENLFNNTCFIVLLKFYSNVVLNNIKESVLRKPGLSYNKVVIDIPFIFYFVFVSNMKLIVDKKVLQFCGKFSDKKFLEKYFRTISKFDWFRQYKTFWFEKLKWKRKEYYSSITSNLNFCYNCSKKKMLIFFKYSVFNAEGQVLKLEKKIDNLNFKKKLETQVNKHYRNPIDRNPIDSLNQVTNNNLNILQKLNSCEENVLEEENILNIQFPLPDNGNSNIEMKNINFF